MSVADNKSVVGRWFTEFWGPEFNPVTLSTQSGPTWAEVTGPTVR